MSKQEFDKLQYQDLLDLMKDSNELLKQDVKRMQDLVDRLKDSAPKQYRATITWRFPLATAIEMSKFKQAQYTNGEWQISKSIRITTRRDFTKDIEAYAEHCERLYFYGLNFHRTITKY